MLEVAAKQCFDHLNVTLLKLLDARYHVQLGDAVTLWQILEVLVRKRGNIKDEEELMSIMAKRLIKDKLE